MKKTNEIKKALFEIRNYLLELEIDAETDMEKGEQRKDKRSVIFNAGKGAAYSNAICYIDSYINHLFDK